MGIKAGLSLPFAKWVTKKIARDATNPRKTQQDLFIGLISSARDTVFGKAHHFSEIRNYEEYKKAVPVRDYEEFKPFIDMILGGQKDVLWPGKPLYLCKTSGTTSGSKYIPISAESMSNHINSARNALLAYIAETNKAKFVAGKMIFLQGSPELQIHEESGIPIGRLSGIVANHVPSYLQKNRLPSYDTNCIEDWEEKVDAIVEETINADMRLISGIPPWVQMYFERLLERSGKSNITELFPNFSLFVYGGLNYEPYRIRFEDLIGKSIPAIELYPASEGFIAYQDSQAQEGMLLVLNDGIFYEFIPADQFFEDDPPRYHVGQVELGVNYAIVLSTNAGLWAYSIGDTVKFTSLIPPRIQVTGRIKHFISAFGEHVIGEEVEAAIAQTCKEFGIAVSEFSVAPLVNPSKGLPFHEWLVEFEDQPESLDAFATSIDEKMQEQNSYYKDLIDGGMLKNLEIRALPPGAFQAYMKSIGKLGGQNKIPRLSNDRKLADAILTLDLA